MTTGNQQNSDDGGWKIVVDTISKFLIPFLVLGLTWQHNQVQKLEERIYQLQATAVTEQKLQTTKQEIISFVDTISSSSAVGFTCRYTTNKYKPLGKGVFRLTTM